MSLRTRKTIYVVYLILLPLLLIGIKLIDKQADIISSRTYSSLHYYISFFLTILSGILIGSDFWIIKSSGFNRKNCCLLKLVSMVLLLFAYEVTIRGLLYSGPILAVSELLLATGFQLITAFYFLLGTK